MSSVDGEVLGLYKRVALEKSAEVWLARLKDSIGETLKRYLSSALSELGCNNAALEDLTVKYPTQICLIGCLFVWTKEAEYAILGEYLLFVGCRTHSARPCTLESVKNTFNFQFRFTKAKVIFSKNY